MLTFCESEAVKKTDVLRFTMETHIKPSPRKQWCSGGLPLKHIYLVCCCSHRTKTFLPLLKRSKGRILIMSSAAGLGCGYPVTSPYSCSKHAVENFASTLRQEMRPWGIKVSAPLSRHLWL